MQGSNAVGGVTFLCQRAYSRGLRLVRLIRLERGKRGVRVEEGLRVGVGCDGTEGLSLGVIRDVSLSG